MMKSTEKFLKHSISAVRCGSPTSSRLHNPEIRQMNRMERKAKGILNARRLQRAEQERVAQRDAIAKQQQLAKVAGKQSRFGSFVNKVKTILQKKIW